MIRYFLTHQYCLNLLIVYVILNFYFLVIDINVCSALPNEGCNYDADVTRVHSVVLWGC